MEPIKMTLGYSVALFTIVDKILYIGGSNVENPVERSLPFNVKYKLRRASDVLIKDYAHYEQFRTTLIKNLGVEGDGKISVPEDKMEEFRASMTEMMSTEVEHTFMKLKPSEVNEITDGIDVTYTDMDLFISYLVEDDSLVKDLMSPIGEVKAEEVKEEPSVEEPPTEGN